MKTARVRLTVEVDVRSAVDMDDDTATDAAINAFTQHYQVCVQEDDKGEPVSWAKCFVEMTEDAKIVERGEDE